jgi:hypothetical protein
VAERPVEPAAALVEPAPAPPVERGQAEQDVQGPLGLTGFAEAVVQRRTQVGVFLVEAAQPVRLPVADPLPVRPLDQVPRTGAVPPEQRGLVAVLAQLLPAVRAIESSNR